MKYWLHSLLQSYANASCTSSYKHLHSDWI